MTEHEPIKFDPIRSRMKLFFKAEDEGNEAQKRKQDEYLSKNTASWVSEYGHEFEPVPPKKKGVIVEFTPRLTPRPDGDDTSPKGA